MVYADANKDMADMAEEAIFSGALFVLPEVFADCILAAQKLKTKRKSFPSTKS